MLDGYIYAIMLDFFPLSNPFKVKIKTAYVLGVLRQDKYIIMLIVSINQITDN